MDRDQKVHWMLAAAFTVVGVLASWQIVATNHRDMEQNGALARQVQCNSALITVLRDRSNARLAVDNTTRDAQISLVTLLEDIQDRGVVPPNDVHLAEAIRLFTLAANAREAPQLSLPYVDCH